MLPYEYSSVDYVVLIFFFFQAEDGIRDLTVTGVQTCALPISSASGRTELVGRVNENRDSTGRRLIKDARDVAAVALASNTGHADADIHIARAGRLIKPGSLPQGRVLAATGIGRKGIRTYGRVSDPVRVSKKGE